VLGAAKQERQVEDVEVVDDGPQRPDADPGELQGADLSLLDRLLLPAQLHRRVHLDAEPTPGCRFELLPHVLDRLNRWIAFGMDVRCLQNQLLIRRVRTAEGRPEQHCRRRQMQNSPSDNHMSLHFDLFMPENIHQVIR
jgi:hypothetical protein